MIDGAIYDLTTSPILRAAKLQEDETLRAVYETYSMQKGENPNPEDKYMEMRNEFLKEIEEALEIERKHLDG